MRRRFVQDAKTGKLVEMRPMKGTDISNTFQVGDLPDIMKDVERRKRDQALKNRQERLRTCIDVVNRHYN